MYVSSTAFSNIITDAGALYNSVPKMQLILGVVAAIFFGYVALAAILSLTHK